MLIPSGRTPPTQNEDKGKNMDASKLYSPHVIDRDRNICLNKFGCWNNCQMFHIQQQMCKGAAAHISSCARKGEDPDRNNPPCRAKWN